MSTDLLPAAPRDEYGNAAQLPEPGTGVELNLGAPAPELVEARRRLEALVEEARAVRTLIDSELAIRLDATGKRTNIVDGVRLKVNPPTEDVYSLGELRADLVEAGYEAQADAITRYPAPPKTPPPALDKRALEGLLKSDDRRLLAIIARHRRRQALSRKVDVLTMPVESTADEL